MSIVLFCDIVVKYLLVAPCNIGEPHKFLQYVARPTDGNCNGDVLSFRLTRKQTENEINLTINKKKKGEKKKTYLDGSFIN